VEISVICSVLVRIPSTYNELCLMLSFAGDSANALTMAELDIAAMDNEIQRWSVTQCLLAPFFLTIIK